MADSAIQSQYQILFDQAQRTSNDFFNRFEKLGANAGSKSAENLGKGFDGFGTRIGRVFDFAFGTLLANAVTKGVQTSSALLSNGFGIAINFEQQISSIKALTGATATEIERIKAVSITLGKDTAFSALEAAQGFEELLKAGLSLDQVLNGGIAGALDLASAGGIAVADAATLASTALNTFSKDGLSVSRAADILAGAANSSAANMSDLKFGLAAVGNVAVLAGQSFEDTATALALFTNNGLKGSDAGTSLKTFLNNLIPTTNTAEAAFDELGLSVNGVGNAFLNADGSFKDLSQISEILTNATKGLSESQKSLALETIFGSDAIRAAAILAKGGAKDFDALKVSINAISAQDVANERLNNLAGVLETLRGTFETLSIQTISPLLPKLSQLGTSFNDLLGAIDPSVFTSIGNGLVYVIEQIEQLPSLINQISDWYNDNSFWINTLASVLLGLGIGFGIVATGVKIYNTVMAIATAVTTGYAAVLAFVTSPLFLIGLAIGVVIAAGILLYQNWGFLTEQANILGQTISNVFTGILNFITNWAASIIAPFQPYIDILIYLGQVATFYVGKVLVEAFKTVANFVGSKVTQLINDVQSFADFVLGIAGGFYVRNLQPIVNGFNDLNTRVQGPLNDFRNTFVDVANSISRIFSDVFNGLAGIVSSGIRTAGNVAINQANRLINNINDIVKSIPEIPGITKPKLLPTIPGFATGVRNFGGGYAVVGEQGPEIINLPKGTNVFNNSDTRKLLQGQNVSGLNRNNSGGIGESRESVTNIQNNTYNNFGTNANLFKTRQSAI